MALSITDTVHIFCAWLKAGRRRFMDADRAEIQGMVQLAGTIELLGVRPIEIRTRTAWPLPPQSLPSPGPCASSASATWLDLRPYPH